MARGAGTRSAAEEASRDEPALTAGDIGRRAAAGAAVLSAKGVFAQVLSLLSTIVVTRLLVPGQLGLYAIAVSISTFLLMLSGGVGMAGALIRRPTAPDRTDLRAYVALQLGITTVIVGMVALATLPFGLVGQLTVVMIASAPITAFRGAALVMLERQLLYKRIATAETAEAVAYFVWTVVTVAALGWGLWGLATAAVIRSVVGTAFIVGLSPAGIVWPRVDLDRIRAMLGIGVRVQAIDFVVAIRDQVLVLGAAVVGSVSIVAYWSLVLRALQAPALLLWTLVRVSFPAMSRAKSAGKDPATMLPRLLPAATILAGTLLVPLAGSAPALVPLLFGHRWSPAVDALSLACLAVVVHTPLMIAGQSLLWTSGDARSPLRAMIADALVCVFLGLPLVPVIGVLGLAVGGVVAATLHTVILARAVDRQTGGHALRHIRTPVLVWIVAAGTAWACADGPGPLVARAAISACLSVALYLGLLFLIRRELMVGLLRDSHPWVRRRLLRRVTAAAPTASNA